MSPPRARGGACGSSMGESKAPNFTYSATASTQALDPHAKLRLRGTKWQRNGTSAEEHGLAGSLLYSRGVSSAWNPSPTQVQKARSKTTTKSKKHTHTTQGQPQVKGHQKHQHFTAAQNLTRHGQHHGTGKTEAGRAKE